MRVILVTGKGGVGKTTVAAATAVLAADRGYRVLISSTDPAHSLADALDQKLGDVESEILPRLWGQQIDTQSQLDRHWGSIRDQIMQVRLGIGPIPEGEHDVALQPLRSRGGRW